MDQTHEDWNKGSKVGEGISRRDYLTMYVSGKGSYYCGHVGKREGTVGGSSIIEIHVDQQTVLSGAQHMVACCQTYY